MNSYEIRVNNTIGKLAYLLRTHKSICVSVSGGSDSDIIVHLIATYFREYLPRIHFIFANTGIEYRATLQHLQDLRDRYDIEIIELRGMPIPVAVKTYGVPFVSKQVSDYMQRLQKHKFAYEDKPFAELWPEKYPRCKVGCRWWTNDFGEKSRYNIDWNTGLKAFLIKEKPKTKISAECCLRSKKGVLIAYQKSVNCDLYITGERKSEGGSRVGAHSSCFETSHGLDHYMPLWFWTDDEKYEFKRSAGIRYSDCYEVWGLRRTGCVGCPFGQNLWRELELMKQYEPQCYKLCMNVFKESYELRKKYELSKEVKT
ncbi:MAG: phosphoadenosine phosphosulfate reductase family protein [Ruminococcus sp.]|nr:phosphoadenosine phosphosulfate reductase family protein [Ruminococcus sp.]